MSELEQTFNEIVHEYSERLYWHVRSIVCSHEDADDLLQEIFIKVWRALPDFRGDAHIYTWLWRIATNESLNFLRRKRARTALSFLSISSEMESQVSSDPYFNGDEAEALFAKALSALPDKQRAVFCMRYYEDLSYKEISEITGTSEGALKASYHFAYEKIKKYVENRF